MTGLSTLAGICRAGTSLGMTPKGRREVGRARESDGANPPKSPELGSVGSLRATIWPGHRLLPNPPHHHHHHLPAPLGV